MAGRLTWWPTGRAPASASTPTSGKWSATAAKVACAPQRPSSGRQPGGRRDPPREPPQDLPHDLITLAVLCIDDLLQSLGLDAEERTAVYRDAARRSRYGG